MTHHLSGRKQTPEHIAKRVAAWKRSSAPIKARDALRKLNVSRAGVPQSEASNQKRSVMMRGKRNSFGVKRDEEFRRKLSDYWSDNREKHNHYVDGKYAERASARIADMQRLDYRLWREAVFKRDDWTCVRCGERGGKLHADHIKEYAKYPDLRYDVENGRTLCVACHRSRRRWENDATAVVVIGPGFTEGTQHNSG